MPALLTPCRAAALAGLALAGIATPARAANTWVVDCSGGTITENGSMVSGGSGLTASNALGALLGTPISPPLVSPGPVAGDTVKINSICTQDIELQIAGLVITNDGAGPGTLVVGDGLQGQFEIAGAGNTTINGILVGINAGSFSFLSGEFANLYVHDGAALALQNAQVSNGPLVGVEAARSATVSIASTTISGNGAAATDDNTNMGVLATDNSTVLLGKSNGSDSVTISNNSGAGIVANDASSLSIDAAAISGNTREQVYLLGASSAFLNGENANDTQITAPSTGTFQAILAVGSSTVIVQQDVTITGGETKAAVGLDASTLILQGSTVSSGNGAASPGSSEATLHGTGNSVIALAGGNNVCFGAVASPCNVLSTGTVIGADHVSTLVQINPTFLGLTMAADNLGGGATIALQSTVDLGLGTVSGQPSLVWNAFNAGISVAQNSSFRLQGGTQIAGKVKLSQGSNGFFNTVNGGTNNVTQGVTCPFTTVPAAHAVAANFVSPTIPLAASMTSVPANTCLSF